MKVFDLNPEKLWGKAIVFSVIFHLICFLAIGYVAASQPPEPPPEELQVLELDRAEDDLAVEEEEPPPEEEEEPPQPVPPLQEEEPAKPVAVVPEPVILPLEEPVSAPLKEIKPVRSKPQVMGTPPVVLARAYPSAEEAGEFKGTIVLRVQILTNGMPGKIVVVVRSGHKRLNEAAIAAARKWRFIPAKDHDGEPMPCLTIMSIAFDPKNQEALNPTVPNQPADPAGPKQDDSDKALKQEEGK